MIYLASPYTNHDQAVVASNHKQAVEATGRLLAAGHMIFSPVAHSHAVATQCKLPVHWQFWQTWCLECVRRCDEVWVLCLPGWEESVGIKAELAEAKKHGKLTSYIKAWAGEQWVLSKDLPGIFDVVHVPTAHS